MRINYEETKEYFEGTKHETRGGILSKVLMYVAAALLFLGWGIFGGFNFVLQIVLWVAAFILYKKETEVIVTEPKMTDAEIDMLQYSINAQEAIRMAMDKFGLDEDEFQEIDPIVLSGPYFNSISTDYKTIKGKDGRVRSSNTEITVFLFSAQQVFQFSRCFSLINPEESRYSTNEYFYRDIVTVSTESDVIEYVDKIERKWDPVTKVYSDVPTMAKYSYEKFVMRTTGGNSVSCAVRTTGESVQRSIQAMRQLLREKKNA